MRHGRGAHGGAGQRARKQGGAAHVQAATLAGAEERPRRTQPKGSFRDGCEWGSRGRRRRRRSKELQGAASGEGTARGMAKDVAWALTGPES